MDGVVLTIAGDISRKISISRSRYSLRFWKPSDAHSGWASCAAATALCISERVLLGTRQRRPCETFLRSQWDILPGATDISTGSSTLVQSFAFDITWVLFMNRWVTVGRASGSPESSSVTVSTLSSLSRDMLARTDRPFWIS